MPSQNQDAFIYDGAREETLLEHQAYAITRKVRSVWTGFVDFALRDNVLEVAVGLMYVLSLSLSIRGSCLTLSPESLRPSQASSIPSCPISFSPHWLYSPSCRKTSKNNSGR